MYLGSRKRAVAGMPVWDEAFTANDGVEPELARPLELVESGAQDVALFIEGVTEFAGSMVQMALVNLMQAAVKVNYFWLEKANRPPGPGPGTFPGCSRPAAVTCR